MVCAEAVELLERAGLVDDGRFATSRADALAGRGYGDAYIRADLERQGVDPELAARVLAAIEPERARAERIVARKGGEPATGRHLTARGFDGDTVEAVLAHLIAADT